MLTTTKAPANLGSFEAQSLGLCTRCLRFTLGIAPSGRKTRFPLLSALRDGIGYPQDSNERFPSCFLHLFLLSQAFLTQCQALGWHRARTRPDGSGWRSFLPLGEAQDCVGWRTAAGYADRLAPRGDVISAPTIAPQTSLGVSDVSRTDARETLVGLSGKDEFAGYSLPGMSGGLQMTIERAIILFL